MSLSRAPGAGRCRAGIEKSVEARRFEGNARARQSSAAAAAPIYPAGDEASPPRDQRQRRSAKGSRRGRSAAAARPAAPRGLAPATAMRFHSVAVAGSGASLASLSSSEAADAVRWRPPRRAAAAPGADPGARAKSPERAETARPARRAPRRRRATARRFPTTARTRIAPKSQPKSRQRGREAQQTLGQQHGFERRVISSSGVAGPFRSLYARLVHRRSRRGSLSRARLSDRMAIVRTLRPRDRSDHRPRRPA